MGRKPQAAASRSGFTPLAAFDFECRQRRCTLIDKFEVSFFSFREIYLELFFDLDTTNSASSLLFTQGSGQPQNVEAKKENVLRKGVIETTLPHGSRALCLRRKEQKGRQCIWTALVQVVVIAKMTRQNRSKIVVHVKSYIRERFGKQENVRKHTRRFPKPRQMTFNFSR